VNTHYTFNDILIKPKFSRIKSRKDVDLSVQLGPIKLTLPVLSANMNTVTEVPMAVAMSKYGGLGVLHRFDSISNTKSMYENVVAAGENCAVSVGLGYIELERARVLYAAGAEVFVLDVASAANINVVSQYVSLKTECPDSFIIVGNFATYDSINIFMEEVYKLDNTIKLDAVKIGIGPGAVCTTRTKTGIGVPQFSALEEVYTILHTSINPKDIPLIIADGGLKTPGDIAKALMFSDLVMCGGMLAGTLETPGKVVNSDGEVISKNTENLYPIYKKYKGSASQESYEEQGKVDSHRTSEGESIFVAYKGPVNNILQDIEGGLRSSLSYTGAEDLQEFKQVAEYIVVSNSSYVEGTAHGKKD
jgi:IMP dehydrogenase